MLTRPRQLGHLAARLPACAPQALIVTLGLFLFLALLMTSGAPVGSRLAGAQVLEKLLDQKQLFFRLLFASRAFSLDLARALSSHLIRRTRSAVRVRGSRPPCRVFSTFVPPESRLSTLDVERSAESPSSHGRTNRMAYLTAPGEVRANLEHLGLPTLPGRLAPARGPPQNSWF